MCNGAIILWTCDAKRFKGGELRLCFPLAKSHMAVSCFALHCTAVLVFSDFKYM